MTGSEPAPPRCRAKLLHWKTLLGLATVSGIAAARIHGEVGAPPPAPPAAAPQSVLVAPVERRDLVKRFDIAAEFAPFHEVALHAKVTGYVQQLAVDIGDRVKAGEVLATLDVPELGEDLRKARAAAERSRQEAARAEAAYEDAHLSFTRIAAVMKQHENLVAQQDVDAARARDATTHAAYVAAQSAIAEAEANVTRIRDLLAYSRITAPFDGVVTERYADPGALLGAGTSAAAGALVRVSQMDPLRLVLPLPEAVVPRVHVGDTVEVHIEALNRMLAAHIARVSDRIDTDTRTMHVEVDVPNADLSLTPGMYATVSLTLDARTRALSIPVESVGNRKRGEGEVLVVGPDHRLAEREVKLGLETPRRIEVLAGLGEHDYVVTGNRSAHAPGETVAPQLADGGATP